MEKNIVRKQVIIIGGGAAGLGAAQHLVHNGITDLIILEANNRLVIIVLIVTNFVIAQ